jgi:hypothetical protein
MKGIAWARAYARYEAVYCADVQTRDAATGFGEFRNKPNTRILALFFDL